MKTLRVVVSLLTRENDFQLEQAAAAEETAAELGVNLEILYADNDSIQQSQQILKFVQADPDDRPSGIIFEPVGGPALQQVALAAVRAGIAWVVLNREVEYVKELRKSSSSPVFGVTSDNLEIGRIEGTQIAALLPMGGTVLYLQGPADTDACKLRTVGMYETKPENIQVRTMKGSWTEASAHKAITAWLRLSTAQHEHIDLVAAQNDVMALGAKKAFQQFSFDGPGRERWLSVPFIGVDGVPKTGQEWVRDGRLTATIITPPLAGTALEMLARALQNATLPPEFTRVPPLSFPSLEELAAGVNRKGSHEKTSKERVV